MAVTASEIFDFLDHHLSCSIERHEIYSAAFSALRRGVRTIVVRLSDLEDNGAQEAAEQLRARLSEWLTVPILFDASLPESISALGDPEAVETRWGRDVREAYDAALSAAVDLQRLENPLRAKVGELISRVAASGNNWRIFCHSRARAHFESLECLTGDTSARFLHSVRDYRESSPFDVLVKVGPLRSRGWGSAPDALLTAPRFATLLQIVWSGCNDEQGFGYDPADCEGTAAQSSAPTARNHRQSTVSWTRRVIDSGERTDATNYIPDIDELNLFQELARGSEMRNATLIQIEPEYGILYPPHSQVPSFDSNPNSVQPIGYRIPGETLTEGAFVILPALGSADLGTLQAGEGHFSRIWKSRLLEAFRRDSDGLLQRLRAAGIDLLNLRSCVRHWCRAASTVIHAPQQRRHFEALVRTLGIDHEPGTTSQMLRHPWWQYAWSEIAHARGEAIQTGMQEHEIVDEQLFLILNELLLELRTLATSESVFQIDIPAGKTLSGAVRFCRVLLVEEGFSAPDTALKQICDLDSIEQWRA